MQLEDVVLSTINSFISNNVLFTALDVSNKVKETLPFARHREVRDLVRCLFVSDIETNGYARTPINVNLEDGSTATALLYHPLSDSWDLDNKYDVQMRAQNSLRPSQNIAPTGTVAPTMFVPTSTPVSTNMVPAAPPTNTMFVPTSTPVSANAQWNNLFNNQPSLFPTK